MSNHEGYVILVKAIFPYNVGFGVLTAVVMNSFVFWDIMPCSPLKVDRRFGATCRLHLQGRRLSQTTHQREGGSKQSCLLFASC
jgi:hypothetical protein